MSADTVRSLSRRSLIAGLAALATLPRIVRAQRGQRTIAWFGIGGPDDFLPYLNGLQTGLREAHCARLRHQALSVSARACRPGDRVKRDFVDLAVRFGA